MISEAEIFPGGDAFETSFSLRRRNATSLSASAGFEVPFIGSIKPARNICLP
jgi:hypothetical protein